MRIKIKNKLGFTILALATLVIPIGLTAFQQQAYAPRVCPGCVEFKKMTHEFEKIMIAAIAEGNTDGENDDLEKFALFMRSQFAPDPALDNLIANYEDGVRRILSAPPPDDGRSQEQIKEFKQLTHIFRTEVLDLAHEGFSEGPR